MDGERQRTMEGYCEGPLTICHEWQIVQKFLVRQDAERRGTKDGYQKKAPNEVRHCMRTFLVRQDAERRRTMEGYGEDPLTICHEWQIVQKFLVRQDAERRRTTDGRKVRAYAMP